MSIGYLMGTDPILLTKLNLKGHGTMPLGNYWDGHGKMLDLLKKGEVTLVVGYLHKVLPPMHEDRPTPFDMLNACKIHEIPVFLIIPAGYEAQSKELLGDAADFVTLVTPETVEAEVNKVL